MRCIQGRSLIQCCSSAHAQQDGHDTISGVISLCYAMAVKLAFGSPHDEEVLDDYLECDHFAWSCSNCVSFNNTAHSIRGRAVFHSPQATYAVYLRVWSIRRARKYGISPGYHEFSRNAFEMVSTYIFIIASVACVLNLLCGSFCIQRK